MVKLVRDISNLVSISCVYVCVKRKVYDKRSHQGENMAGSENQQTKRLNAETSGDINFREHGVTEIPGLCFCE